VRRTPSGLTGSAPSGRRSPTMRCSRSRRRTAWCQRQAAGRRAAGMAAGAARFWPDAAVSRPDRVVFRRSARAGGSVASAVSAARG
jgi:hypothetical protein